MTQAPQMSGFVLSVLLDDLRAAVAKGVRNLMAYEAGETDGLTEAMSAVVDGVRIADKFGVTNRHGGKTVLTRQALFDFVNDFPTNEYSRQQAERSLSKDIAPTLADMWAWLNELGSYIPKG